jgi:hypothetical protein
MHTDGVCAVREENFLALGERWKWPKLKKKSLKSKLSYHNWKSLSKLDRESNREVRLVDFSITRALRRSAPTITSIRTRNQSDQSSALGLPKTNGLQRWNHHGTRDSDRTEITSWW